MNRITLQRDVTSRNDEAAARLRALFARRRLLVLNLLSSPGSGKTSLLEQTARQLGGRLRLAVIEGDLQTDRDAERVRRAGVPAIQINTNGGCHLDARMVEDALAHLDLDALDVLFIENVGNLVCPACFDLGEDQAVLLVSVTEGDDKPGKYPTAFLKADLLVLNKTDLLPHTDFNVERFREDVAKIKASLPLLSLSCKPASGLDAWFAWLQAKLAAKRQH